MNDKPNNHLCNKMFSFIFRISELELLVLNYLSPLVNLTIRLWVANIFWQSGLLKLPKDFLWIGKGNWQSTIYLFTHEHPLPGFPPEVAAFLGTSFEILCPILLVFGFGTRVASFILIIMTIYINFAYQHDIAHIYWMILLSVLLFQGPGKISIDNIIRTKTLSSDKYKKMAKIA
jgi:putative oxidoreductase